MNRPSEKPRSSKHAGSSLKFTPPVRTKSELISIGAQAADLMSAPVFGLAYESTVRNIQDRIIETEPHEVQKREWLNMQVQALGAVALELTKMASLAIELNKESPATLSSEARNQADQRAFRRGNIIDDSAVRPG